MKAILHIGINKTGTTSIQSFLVKNRKMLRKQGFLYPRTLGSTQHIKLAAYALDSNDLTAGYRIRMGLTSSQSLEAFRSNLREKLSNELAAAPIGTKTVIFSAESCSAFSQESELYCLKNLLSEFFDDIEVVVYLRRQDQFAVSLYSTTLKGGGNTTKTPFEIERILDYAQLLELWGGVYGVENLTVRLYSSADLVGGDALSDFCEVCGIRLEDMDELPARSNTSLNTEGHIFLETFNGYLPKIVDGIINPLRGPVKLFMEKEYSGRPPLPSRQEAMGFYQKYADSNSKVCANWFPGRPTLFNENFSKYPEQEDTPDLTFEDGVGIAASLWKNLMEENIRLKKELAELQPPKRAKTRKRA
jgi:hypothetical protein